MKLLLSTTFVISPYNLNIRRKGECLSRGVCVWVLRKSLKKGFYLGTRNLCSWVNPLRWSNSGGDCPIFASFFFTIICRFRSPLFFARLYLFPALVLLRIVVVLIYTLVSTLRNMSSPSLSVVVYVSKELRHFYGMFFGVVRKGFAPSPHTLEKKYYRKQLFPYQEWN